MNRLNEIKRWMDENRKNIVIELLRQADDNKLSETGRCVKYAYELLDILNLPNDKDQPRRK